MKIAYYKLVKTKIDVVGLAKVIINVIIKYHGLLHSIVRDQDLLFTSKFSFMLCYFFGIKQKLRTTFYL